MTLNGRVRVLKCNGKPGLIGKTGTVIGIWPKCVLVEFEEDVSGPLRCHGKSGRQWYFPQGLPQPCLQGLEDDSINNTQEEIEAHSKLRAAYVVRFWKAISFPPTEAERETVKLLHAGTLTDGQLKAVVEDMEASMFKLG